MEELYRLLPDEYVSAIRTRLLPEKLSEVRIINGAPVRVCYDSAYRFLCRTGITSDADVAFIADKRAADGVVMRACEHSLYTVTETLKRGYIAVGGGIRIGVCGSGVVGNGELSALKDFLSVNIRIPHQITDCAVPLYAKILRAGRIMNTLVLSPPGAGKTTLVRDLCRLISDGGLTVLLCDERYELAAVHDGVASLDVGCRTDIFSGIDKKDVFEMGIANMSPNVIIADELFERDIIHVRRAVTCGISVVATIHADGLEDFAKKSAFSGAPVFERYAVLTGAPMRSMTVHEGLE